MRDNTRTLPDLLQRPLGVPQGGPFSPLAANIYLNDLDWAFDTIRRKTAEGPYEAVNYPMILSSPSAVTAVSGGGLNEPFTGSD